VGVEIGNVAKDEGAREEILSCSISVASSGWRSELYLYTCCPSV